MAQPQCSVHEVPALTSCVRCGDFLCRGCVENLVTLCCRRCGQQVTTELFVDLARQPHRNHRNLGCIAPFVGFGVLFLLAFAATGEDMVSFGAGLFGAIVVGALSVAHFMSGPQALLSEKFQTLRRRVELLKLRLEALPEAELRAYVQRFSCSTTALEERLDAIDHYLDQRSQHPPQYPGNGAG